MREYFTWFFDNILNSAKEALWAMWKAPVIETVTEASLAFCEFFALKNWESWSPLIAAVVIVIILSIFG